MMEKTKKTWPIWAKIIAVCLALALLGALIYGAVKLFDVGENVIQGSWQYNARITSTGDVDSVFHFAADGSFYLESPYDISYGTYSLLKGGNQGTFVTNIMGDEIMYDYVLNGSILTITQMGTNFKMELHRLNK